MAVWDPSTKDAFSADAQRQLSVMQPRSAAREMVHVLTLLVPVHADMHPLGRMLLRQIIISLARFTSGYSQKLLGFAHASNHPLLLESPFNRQYRDADVVEGTSLGVIRSMSLDKEDPYITWNPSSQTLDLAEKTACPRNRGGTSCFTDTPFVIMFLGTNAFDPVLFVAEPPSRFATSLAETAFFNAEDDSKDLCDDADGQTTVAQIRRLARNVVAGLRSGKEEREFVETNVAAFRSVLDKCYPSLSIAAGEEDAGIVYESLILMSGWSRWFGSPLVEFDVVRGQPQDPPTQFRITKASNRRALKSVLNRPDTDRPTTLQQAVDATFPSRTVNQIILEPTDFDEMQNIINADLSGAETSRIDGVLRQAVPIFLRRAVRERQAFVDDLVRQNITTAYVPNLQDTTPFALPEKTQDMLNLARATYTQTLGAIALEVTTRKRFSTNLELLELDKEREETQRALAPLFLTRTIETIQFMTHTAPSGTMVLDASAYKFEDGKALDYPLDIPENNIIDVSVGLPGFTKRQAYRIFGVIIKTGPVLAGHFVGYFRFRNTWYLYNDLVGVPKLPGVGDPTIRQKGLYFFMQRLSADGEDQSPGTLPGSDL